VKAAVTKKRVMPWLRFVMLYFRSSGYLPSRIIAGYTYAADGFALARAVTVVKGRHGWAYVPFP
jgi:hypothetical protein